MQRAEHRPIPDHERLLPNHMTTGVLEAVTLVDPNDLAGKVDRGVIVRPGRNIHRMHGGHPARHEDARDLLHDEVVVLKELGIILAIAQVAGVAGILIEQPSERRGVDHQVHAAIGERAQHLDAVVAVERVPIGGDDVSHVSHKHLLSPTTAVRARARHRRGGRS